MAQQNDHEVAVSVDELLEQLSQVRKRKILCLANIQELKQKIKTIQAELTELDLGMVVKDVVEEGSSAMKIAKRTFNQDPKEGVKYLLENKLVDNDPGSVAQFLIDANVVGTPDTLNKTKIGEYLGENETFNKDVLAAFAQKHDFRGFTFDKALRLYLWSFRLPGEAQKIDRMMEAFAVGFCTANPGLFSSKDTCYVLAFSIIMLATNLHNPAIKIKQSLQSFITMNRGIDNGKDIDPQLLAQLYDSIKASPFKIPDDAENSSIAFFNPERDGWLTKEGGAHKSWKKRWFTLIHNCLYYFESQESTKPKGTIPLRDLEVREIVQDKRPFCFEILCVNSDGNIKAAKTDRQGKYVQGRHTSYKIQAKDRAEMEDWMKCIKGAIMKDPVFELYRQKRVTITNH